MRAMSKTPLPRHLDVRRAAARSACVAGSVAVSELERLGAAVMSGGEASAELRFWRDDQGRYRVDVDCRADVVLVCQRCLGPLRTSLEGRSMLVALWSEEQAVQLPRELEPLLTAEETDLWTVLDEELLLGLPVAPVHPPGLCTVPESPASEEQAGREPTPGPQRNPFAALEALRPTVDGTDEE